MGFLSGLGKALGLAGSVAAAPFTGGGSLAAAGPILTAGGKIAEVAGSASRNRQGGRVLESQILSDRDRNRILADRAFEDSILGRGRLDLEQRRFQEEAPNARLTRSGGLDRIRNFDQRMGAFSESPHTFDINGRKITVPRFQTDFSAFRPSAETMSLADLIAARDLEAQGAGDQFAALPELQKTQLSDLPQSGKFDTLLNTTAGIGGIMGVLGEILKEQQESKRSKGGIDGTGATL